jgi:hypothetical protein
MTQGDTLTICENSSDYMSGVISCQSNNKNQPMSIHELPCDVLQQVADVYLNPRDRSRLSSCSKRLNALLPPLLRIKIVSSAPRETKYDNRGSDGESSQSLVHGFFVTPATSDHHNAKEWSVNATANPHKTTSSTALDRCLKASDHLVYGENYYLWTFDYERGNKVFLGRHTRHGLRDSETGSLHYRYSMGLRPRTPNQTWEVVKNNASSEVVNGEHVRWGEDVGLAVGGTNMNPHLPDSRERKFLSCRHLPDSSVDSNRNNNANDATIDSSGMCQPCWCVVQDKWGPSERLQLMPINEFVPGSDVEEKKLTIHAIAEVCDQGEYLLYSPASLRDGSATCDGFHVTVKFDFWVEKGVMHFNAPVLPFTLGIPILETDYCHEDLDDHRASTREKSPIANLLRIKSARWGCLIYYMAVAADVTEGKALDMNRFLQRVTDHEDHTVKTNEQLDLVYIDVRGKKVRNGGPERPSRSNSTVAATPVSTPWCFVLSW